jgi:RNA polymerase sigma-70 factor (ECF subfamily)
VIDVIGTEQVEYARVIVEPPSPVGTVGPLPSQLLNLTDRPGRTSRPRQKSHMTLPPMRRLLAVRVVRRRATVRRVSVVGDAPSDELALVHAAAAGDEAAFSELVEAHHAELRAHCYRMLGSLHDAEDALQDTLLRVWRGLAGFEGRSSVRSWLYSIATNAALDVTRRKSRRELPVGIGPAAGQGDDLGEPVFDPIWLEPFPDRWLVGNVRYSPEARYEERESVELAFIVALQGLAPLQRAVFLLREVMGFSAVEISDQLGISVSSATSALQRARARVRRARPAQSQQVALRALGNQGIQATVRRYADALERGDADTLISMLTDDATWCMPPISTWFAGHQSIREFLVRWPLTETWVHMPVGCNGQAAVACYLYEVDRDSFIPAVIDVLTMRGDKIAAVTAFLTPDVLGLPADETKLSGTELFARFGLPGRPTV